MIILGIDPGTAITGYGIIKQERNELSCLDFGCITTNSALTQAKRLEQIRKKLKKIIKKHSPDASAVEQLFFAKNTKTALAVAHARGVVLETLSASGVPVSEFTPPQVKQAVTSYGKADKLQVQKMVQLLLSLNNIPKPDDAADALAVAICAANSNYPNPKS